MKTQINNNRIFYLLFILAGMVMLQGCIVYKTVPPAVPVSQIIQMSKDGVYAKDIIKEMRQTHSVYLLKANEYADLRNQGVQDSVLNYMDKTKTDAIRQNERMQNYGYWGLGYPGYWYGGLGFGWPYGYFGYGPGMGPRIVIRGNIGGEHNFGRRVYRGRR